jgi:hypothetical protein
MWRGVGASNKAALWDAADHPFALDTPRWPAGLHLPSIIRLKEEPPEPDYSSFYGNTRAGRSLLCGGGSAFLITWLRTRFHEETLLLTVLQLPFVVRTPQKPNLVPNRPPDGLKTH